MAATAQNMITNILRRPMALSDDTGLTIGMSLSKLNFDMTRLLHRSATAWWRPEAYSPPRTAGSVAFRTQPAVSRGHCEVTRRLFAPKACGTCLRPSLRSMRFASDEWQAAAWSVL